MNRPHTAATAPIFILSHARTGSTLLRYLIDTHPDVCCPPEIALGRLCHDLAYTLALTSTGDLAEHDRASAVSSGVRQHVDLIMDAYCAAKQKRRWCDKSTNNIDHLGTLAEVFPDAQYVCLYRQGMDVVFSLLELFRFGFPGRYGELVARSPGNLVDAMVNSWNEATERLLDFEAAHASRCVRVTYEALVDTPAVAAERMFSFLDLHFDPAILDAAFSTRHDQGPGDLKIQFTGGILRGRTGKGVQVPTQQISEEPLATMNRLHEALGYAPVTREAGGSAFHRRLREASRVSVPVEPRRWG